MYNLTPNQPLLQGETIRDSFAPDRGAYYRNGAWMAAGAMALGMVILWAMGNPHVWTGAIGGLAAVAVRVFYLASDELKVRWDLTNQRLLGPGDRVMDLRDIKQVKTLGSAVQIITHGGDKHLIKYQRDTAQTAAILTSASAGDLS